MVQSRAGLFYEPWQGRTQLRWVDTPGICSPNLSWLFCSGVLSLQEDCHTFLYPSVGMLLDTSHELHSGEAERPASSLSTDLPRRYGVL